MRKHHTQLISGYFLHLYPIILTIFLIHLLTNPGNILNRSSRDLGIIDDVIPPTAADVLEVKLLMLLLMLIIYVLLDTYCKCGIYMNIHVAFYVNNLK